MKNVALAFLFCLGLSNLAHAEPITVTKRMICDKPDTIFKALKDDFNETVVWYANDALTTSKYMLAVNPEKKTWTLVQFDENNACVLGVGDNAVIVPLPGKPT